MYECSHTDIEGTYTRSTPEQFPKARLPEFTGEVNVTDLSPFMP